MIVLKVDMLVKPAPKLSGREYIRILQEHSRKETGLPAVYRPPVDGRSAQVSFLRANIKTPRRWTPTATLPTSSNMSSAGLDAISGAPQPRSV